MKQLSITVPSAKLVKVSKAIREARSRIAEVYGRDDTIRAIENGMELICWECEFSMSDQEEIEEYLWESVS